MTTDAEGEPLEGHMWVGTVGTDANGIVLFDPATLRSWRSGIAIGQDLFTEFITTDAGDAVLSVGAVVPVLAIDDGGYDVVIRTADEISPALGETVVENGAFPLHVSKESDLVIADLAVFRQWLPEVDWTHVRVPCGFYSVTVRGFRRLEHSAGPLLRAGYEFVLSAQKSLPPVTADTGKNMRVLNWWDEPAR